MVVFKLWIAGLILVISFLAFGDRTLGTMARMTRNDDLTLAEGLRRTIDFVDSTTVAVASDFVISPAQNSANPLLAGELRNNHSLQDQSDPHFPGYDDCDGWRNILYDGWSAVHRVEITMLREDEGQQLLRETRQLWEKQGHDTEMWNTTRSTTLYIDAGYAEISLYIEREQRSASITGLTRCLPPQ